MNPHFHIDVITFLTFGLYFIIWGFLLRLLEVWWSGNSVGKALTFIH